MLRTALLATDGRSIRADAVAVGTRLLDEHGHPTIVTAIDRGYTEVNGVRTPRADRAAHVMYEFELVDYTVAANAPTHPVMRVTRTYGPAAKRLVCPAAGTSAVRNFMCITIVGLLACML